jgi:hypothetical protein
MSWLTGKPLLTAALGISATLIAGSVFAGGKNPKILCHNIGGPFDLGANCEATGNCVFILPNGQTITYSGNQFLGILIGPIGEKAIAAHLAHGDGYATQIYDPPLHLAPLVGPHRASNVECLATRVVPQPDEPGN